MIRPVRERKGFRKLHLKPQEKAEVQFCCSKGLQRAFFERRQVWIGESNSAYFGRNESSFESERR